MKQFNNIIQSETEPNVNSLWLDNETLKVHDNGEWIPLSGESTNSSQPSILDSKWYKTWIGEDMPDFSELNTGNILGTEETNYIVIGKNNNNVYIFNPTDFSIMGSDNTQRYIGGVYKEREVSSNPATLVAGDIIYNDNGVDMSVLCRDGSEPSSVYSLIPRYDWVHLENGEWLPSTANEKPAIYDWKKRKTYPLLNIKDINHLVFRENFSIRLDLGEENNYARLITGFTYSTESGYEWDINNFRLQYSKNNEPKDYRILTENDLDSIKSNIDTASKTVKGIVQIGSGLNITETGILSVDTTNIPTKASVTTLTSNVNTVKDNVTTLINAVSEIDTKVDSLAGIKIVTAAEYEAEEKNPEFIYFIKG